jgi:predicted transcriptional regulator
LSKLSGESPRLRFYELVDCAARKDPVIAKHENRLKAYGDLRNAIIHYKDYPKEVIAEPSVAALESFKRIANYIFSPPKLIPAFQTKVRIFTPDAILSEVLLYMKDHDFSQVTLHINNKISVVTTEGIALWMANQIEDDLISISETSLSDVLPYELQNCFEIMDKDKTIDHARDAFEKSLDSKKARLYCIVITDNGTESGEPLGIVTPWDIIEHGNNK